jgi:hypothetical protein
VDPVILKDPVISADPVNGKPFPAPLKAYEAVVDTEELNAYDELKAYEAVVDTEELNAYDELTESDEERA